MTVHGFTKESHRGSGIIGASQWRRTPTCIEAFFEDEDCEDLCPNEEPTFKVQVENAPKPKRRELRPLWWVGTDDVEKCSTCNGTGEQICRFCQSTRFLSGGKLSLGSGLIVSDYLCTTQFLQFGAMKMLFYTRASER